MAVAQEVDLSLTNQRIGGLIAPRLNSTAKGESNTYCK